MLNCCFNQMYNLSLHCFKSYHFILLTWQSLLRDRDKLCQLLEQHPKLMQMLQVVLYRIYLFHRSCGCLLTESGVTLMVFFYDY